MKAKFLILFLFLSITAFAQVGIGTTNPNASAVLDVNSSAKGVLIPQIALTGTTDNTTILNPANSLLIYNTSQVNDVSPGYYYREGTKWLRIVNSGDSKKWSLSGNSGTSVGTNFIGTTDLQDFAIYTNNAEAIRIKSNGNVGIGTSNPGEQLDVTGGMTINSNTVLPRRFGVWNYTQHYGANGVAWTPGYLHIKTNIDPSVDSLMFILHFNGFDYGNGSNIIDCYFSGFCWPSMNNLFTNKINNVLGVANRVSINRWYKSADNKICIVLYSPRWFVTSINLDITTRGNTFINTISVLNQQISPNNANVF